MGKKNDKTPKSSTANLNGLVESYTCTGNFLEDFSALWRRNVSKDIIQPTVKPRKCLPALGDDDPKNLQQGEEEDGSSSTLPHTFHVVEKNLFFQPSIDCEFDGDEAKQSKRTSPKAVHIKGWKVNEAVLSILGQCTLDKLTIVNLWNAGLTDNSFHKFVDFLSALPSIADVTVEGNPIPGTEPFAELLKKDLPIQNLSLRNNQITDVGAEKIGKALGSPEQPLLDLLTLNVAFNRISDNGARGIANGLRMNRSLVALSLASNNISDSGAASLARSLDSFALTHDEIVERRKLLSQRMVLPREESESGSRRGMRNKGGLQVDKGRQRLASPKRKDKGKVSAEKPTKKQDRTKKEVQKPLPKTPVSDNSKQKSAKNKSRFLVSESMSPDLSDQSHPLLNPGVVCKDGKIWMPGCNTLISLNLSRNHIGREGMKCLLQVLKNQSKLNQNVERPGLLKLLLHHNSVPHDNEVYLEIFQIMGKKQPLKEEVFD